MDLFIPDISEWQVGANTAAWRKAGGQAVIARVCYGTRNDAAMVARRNSLRAEGFEVVGWYLFLRTAHSIMDQINAFRVVIPTLQPYEFVVVDWENDLDGTRPDVRMRDAVLNELDTLYGRTTWGYGYAGELQAYPFSARPTWVAAYGLPEPALTHVLWQYTSGRHTSGPYKPYNFPGIGKVDASVFHGSIDQLKQIINPSPGVHNPGAGGAQEDSTVADVAHPDGKRLDRLTVAPDHSVNHFWQAAWDQPWVTEPSLGGFVRSVSGAWSAGHFVVSGHGTDNFVYEKISDGTVWVTDWTRQGDQPLVANPWA